MSLFMPPVLLPSTLLPSNICRFAVNNAKFASLEIFTLSNPRKVEETDLSVSLSFSFFRNSKKGIESYYKSLVERVTFSPVHFPRPSRGIIVIFPRHSCLSQKSCEITAHSFFVELLADVLHVGDGILARGRGYFPDDYFGELSSRGRWMKLGSSRCLLFVICSIVVICRPLHRGISYQGL